METLENWYLQAEKKLHDGVAQVQGSKERAMAKPVADALISFADQQEEFAQAVVQGGSFPECMKAVARGVGSSISDIDAYKKAVQFYFPGALIRLQMTVDLVGDAAAPEEPAAPQQTPLVFNVADFF